MQPTLQLFISRIVLLVVRGRVLIVDEDVELRAHVALKLELLELAVDHAFDYQSAIAKLIRNDYDLVLLDPRRVAGRMHGGHIARWIAEMRLPFAVQFLEKPVRLDVLSEVVRRYIPALARFSSAVHG